MNQSSVLTIANSGPIFRRSTFRNENVLISESLDHIPSIRILMIIICILIGICTFVDLIFNHFKYRLVIKQTSFHRRIVPTILLLNILFHVSHYAHNIYHPAAYFEPEKLYLKKIITEMEQTFLFNFPLSIFFVIASRRLYASCTIGHIESVKMPILVTIYSLMSMVSGGHYTYEPPWKFSLICNMTIAGETILAFLFIIISLFIHRANLSESNAHAYSRLATSSSVQMSQRQLKLKTSDQSAADDESS